MTSAPILSRDISDGGDHKPLAGLRPARFTARTYTAFRISAVATDTPDSPTLLGQVDGANIEEALQSTLSGEYASTQALFHKNALAIRETDGQASRLHLYVIKRKSTPRYVYHNHIMRREHDLYADPVCVIDGTVFVTEGRDRAEGEGLAHPTRAERVNE